ncbi:hypothetical protein B484DRAFT_430907 [Ochromonadaceae sp. CCMP2298]|nr:hypothetical protein B484DRAFT_430907 [Ochromonadaceae sp. CCMP2298]
MRWAQDDESMIVQLRLALQSNHVYWRDWLFEIHNAERIHETYAQLRSPPLPTSDPMPLERALPLDQTQGAPTSAHRPRVSAAETSVLGKPLCFVCGLRGNINADCPWRDEFDRLRAECKQRQVAGAAVGEGEESDSETTCATSEVVLAQPDEDGGEPFKDWLSASLVTEDTSAPAVETCLVTFAPEKTTIMDSSCTSSSTGAPVNLLKNFRSKIKYISLGNADFKVRSKERGSWGRSQM